MKYPILKEVLAGSSERTFKSKIKNVDITADMTGDSIEVEFHTQSMEIEWSVEEESRSFGIKSLMPMLKTKEFELSYLTYSNGGEAPEKEEEGDVKLEITKETEVSDVFDRSGVGSPGLSPSSINLIVEGDKADPKTWKLTHVEIDWDI